MGVPIFMILFLDINLLQRGSYGPPSSSNWTRVFKYSQENTQPPAILPGERPRPNVSTYGSTHDFNNQKNMNDKLIIDLKDSGCELTSSDS